MFCGQCGAKLSDGDTICPRCGISVPEDGIGKEQVLGAIKAALERKTGLKIADGRKCDLEIAGVLADADWGIGRKKVEYKACLRADELGRTVVYWEMLKEGGCGFGSPVCFKKECTLSTGQTLSGSVTEKAHGLEGKLIDYTWDYSQVREAVKTVTEEQGWKFVTVLVKGKAMFPV